MEEPTEIEYSNDQVKNHNTAASGGKSECEDLKLPEQIKNTRDDACDVIDAVIEEMKAVADLVSRLAVKSYHGHILIFLIRIKMRSRI